MKGTNSTDLNSTEAAGQRYKAYRTIIVRLATMEGLSTMKLVVAIVQDYDTDRLLRAMSAEGLRATRIASTGGFLRMGNTTVLAGVDDDQVQICVGLLRTICQARVERPPAHMIEEFGFLGPGTTTEVTIGGAVVFVVPVQRFVRIERPES